MAPSELLQSRPGHLPGLRIVEHTLRVPLDHAQPDGDQIEVFAREVADPEADPPKPYLVFLQGGPGAESPRPMRLPAHPPWLVRALKDYRVLFLDQRGTGRSSPIGLLPGRTPAEQAGYLANFRADSIIADLERLRVALGAETWSVFGQSFGGFCVVTYLSRAPERLREAFIAGGLPSPRRDIDEVYRRTFAKARERTERFLDRYPQDRERLAEIRRAIDAEQVRLPGGEPLTWRRFQQIGSLLGFTGGEEEVHYLLETPLDSPAFTRDVVAAARFERNPLYAILHEACWADGIATRWSAERVRPAEFLTENLLTAEHVFPWMFQEYTALAPLRAAAELLADREWPPLFDLDVLARNRVPVAAIAYYDDLFVEFGLSMEMAEHIGNLRVWVTNEYQHGGIAEDGERVLGRLIDLAHDRLPR